MAVTVIAGFVALSTAQNLPGQGPHDENQTVFSASQSSPEENFERLVATLNAGSPLDKQRAAISLGRLGDKSAVEPLIKALNDPDEFVRNFAVRSLGYLGDPKALAPLTKALEDTEEIVRRSAAMALGSLGDPGAVDPLIKALESDGFLVRRSAAIALGKLGDPRAVDPLIKALESDDIYIQAGAAIALADIGEPSLRKALDLLADWTMGPRVVEILRDLKWQAASSQEQVRFDVAMRNKKALSDNWEVARQVLLEDAQSEDPARVLNAVNALIGIGRDEIVDELAGILENRGNLAMARAFFFSGNVPLSEAGRTWIREHRAELRSENTSPVIEWGGMRRS